MLINILRWLLCKVGAIRKPRFVLRHRPTQPKSQELAPDELVIVGERDFAKWACFKCPGGCGEKIMLALSKSRTPHWQVTPDWLGRPTISPSICQQNECGCHFWVKTGWVEWCDVRKATSDDDNRHE
jgi:hypothetical protein